MLLPPNVNCDDITAVYDIPSLAEIATIEYDLKYYSNIIK
jgi:hypothetical protein